MDDDYLADLIKNDIRVIESATPYGVEIGFMDTSLRVGLVTKDPDNCMDDLLGGPFQTRGEVAAFLAGLQEFAYFFETVENLRSELEMVRAEFGRKLDEDNVSAEALSAFDRENNR